MELMKGYKHTEVGLIPEDWQEYPLKDLVVISSGESPSLFEFHYEGVPYYKVEQLNNSNKFACETEYYIKSTKKIKKGSIVFPKRGASIFLNKIRILLYDSFMDTNLMTLTPIDSLNNEYLFYQLSYIGLSKIADITSIPQINNKHINPFKIPIPKNNNEQSAIANALSDIDELILQTEKLIEKKKAIKQGVMQELLKPKEGWVTKKLGEVFEIEKGTQLNRSILDSSSEFPVYNGGITPSGFTSSYNTNENAIIISEGGNSCGYVNYVKTKFWRGGHCYEMKPNQFLNKHFAYFLLKYKEAEIMTLRVGSGLPNIQKSNLSKYQIKFPDFNKQKVISKILTDMDNQLDILANKLQKLKHQKQGMMQALLTGKIRLI